MTRCKLIPNMPALSDYGFGVCFEYLMLAAPEHNIKSLVINKGTEIWALTEPVLSPTCEDGKDPSRGIPCEMANKEFAKILKQTEKIAFHLKLLSPGGSRLYVTPVVESSGVHREFKTLNDFFDWLPSKSAPEEISASETSRWIRDLFRAKGMGFFVADPCRRTGLAFHHDMVDLVNFDGTNSWTANFYGNCDLKTKIEQDDEEFTEYIGTLCA